MRVTEIVPNGDLILVVGGKKSRKFLVHTSSLINASPVFKALLGPNFEEGHRLAQSDKSNPVEIKLPEDDPSAMDIMLRVIHCRNEKLKETPSPEKIFLIARACDKYNCIDSLAFALRDWFRCEEWTDSVELWVLTVAAMILHDRNAFSVTTSKLIIYHAGSYADLINKHKARLDSTQLLRIAGRLTRWQQQDTCSRP